MHVIHSLIACSSRNSNQICNTNVSWHIEHLYKYNNRQKVHCLTRFLPRVPSGTWSINMKMLTTLLHCMCIADNACCIVDSYLNFSQAFRVELKNNWFHHGLWFLSLLLPVFCHQNNCAFSIFCTWNFLHSLSGKWISKILSFWISKFFEYLIYLREKLETGNVTVALSGFRTSGMSFTKTSVWT